MKNVPQRTARISLGVATLGLILIAGPLHAQRIEPSGDKPRTAARPMNHGIEPEREPRGYARMQRPEGSVNRPQQLNRADYNHNFQARQSFHIGPYHPPAGYQYRRWTYGGILPSIYWGRNYWIGDYWLFGLDVPPAGCEWVRYGPDALLINMANGEVIQTFYGRFA